MKNIDGVNIVKRLQEDDKTAFDWIYNQFSHKIYLNALKLTKDRTMAEDIVQDVFIILWEKRNSIDPSRPLLNWIFVVSYHKSIDYLKRLQKTFPVSDFPLEDNSHQGREEKNEKERQFKLIEQAAKRLSPQQQRVFKLCKMQGKTYKSAAQQLGISRYTVKEYLSIAMHSIRTFVDNRI